MSIAEDIGAAVGIASAAAATSDMESAIVRLPLIIGGAILGRHTAAILTERVQAQETEQTR